MSKKIRIAASAFAALAFVAYSANASAKWVVKSDEWCRSHGFRPVCEVYEKDLAAKSAKGDAKRDLPEVGSIRSFLPATPSISDQGAAGNLSSY